MERTSKSHDEREQRMRASLSRDGPVTEHEFTGGISFMAHHEETTKDEFAEMDVDAFEKIMRDVKAAQEQEHAAEADGDDTQEGIRYTRIMMMLEECKLRGWFTPLGVKVSLGEATRPV